MKRLTALGAILALAAGSIGLSSAPAHAAGRCEEVKFTKSNYHVNEIDGQIEITIKREISLLGCPGTLSYSTSDATAIAPYDYTAISEEYIFTNPQESTHKFTIPIANDVIAEGPETFKVSFEAFNDATTSRGTAIVTIGDNRQPASSPPASSAPPSTTATGSSSPPSSAVVLANKPRPRSSPTAVSQPPPSPVEQEVSAEPPADEPSAESTSAPDRPKVMAQHRGRIQDKKKLFTLLIVALLAATAVILAAWRLRRNPKEQFSSL